MQTASIDNSHLWRNPDEDAPLFFALPGSTGTRLPAMRGFDVIPGQMWLNGFSCYVSVTEGQDGKTGSYSFQRSYEESREVLANLLNRLSPPEVVIFGSCGGGTVATHLARDFDLTRALVLWETIPQYPEQEKDSFAARASHRSLRLAEAFKDEYIHTSDAAHEVDCPVLIVHGDSEKVVTDQDMKALSDLYTNAECVERKKISDGGHDLTRGSDHDNLGLFLDLMKDFLESASK